MLKRERFIFFHEFRVRYSEIDGQGVVFNAHYLTYFDTAITEYIRSSQIDYGALVMEREIDFHTVKATIEFHKPAHFDESIEVGVALGKVGSSSLTWTLAIFKKGEHECLASGEIIWVCTQPGTHKSFPLPLDIAEQLKDLSVRT